jgi:ribulose-5-phosphate 4-epimerase/fuculose-1-phosphate aldolase
VGVFSPAYAVLLASPALVRELFRQRLWQAHYGWDEITWNHISVRTDAKNALITPGKIMYQLITPDDLVLMNEAQNKTGFVIHQAIYDAR